MPDVKRQIITFRPTAIAAAALRKERRRRRTVPRSRIINEALVQALSGQEVGK